MKSTLPFIPVLKCSYILFKIKYKYKFLKFINIFSNVKINKNVLKLLN